MRHVVAVVWVVHKIYSRARDTQAQAIHKRKRLASVRISYVSGAYKLSKRESQIDSIGIGRDEQRPAERLCQRARQKAPPQSRAARCWPPPLEVRAFLRYRCVNLIRTLINVHGQKKKKFTMKIPRSFMSRIKSAFVILKQGGQGEKLLLSVKRLL